MNLPKKRLRAETIPRYHRYFVDAVNGLSIKDIASREDLTSERVTQIVRALFLELLHCYGSEIDAFGFKEYQICEHPFYPTYITGVYIKDLRQKPYFWVSLANRLLMESLEKVKA